MIVTKLIKETPLDIPLDELINEWIRANSVYTIKDIKYQGYPSQSALMLYDLQ